MEYTYRDIKITVNESAQFCARVNGKDIKSASLAAIKKRIDTTKSFEPFDALTLNWHYVGKHTIEKVTIANSKAPKARYSWSNKLLYITTQGKEIPETQLYALDQKTLLESYAEISKGNHKAKKELEARIEKSEHDAKKKLTSYAELNKTK